MVYTHIHRLKHHMVCVERRKFHRWHFQRPPRKHSNTDHFHYGDMPHLPSKFNCHHLFSLHWLSEGFRKFSHSFRFFLKISIKFKGIRVNHSDGWNVPMIKNANILFLCACVWECVYLYVHIWVNIIKLVDTYIENNQI